MTTMFFFTIHDEAGRRIDDDSDYPLTQAQLEAALAGFDPIEIAGEKAWRNGDQVVRFQQVAE